jgi:hypothetical protein
MSDEFETHSAEFAMALHKHFGYPLGALLSLGYDEDTNEYYTMDVLHAFCYAPGRRDVIVDSQGIRPKRDVKAAFKSSLYEEQELTPEELADYYRLNSAGWEDDAFAVITADPQKFEVTTVQQRVA